MLGNDSRLLTDEEIKSHDLFNRLTSKETITGEDEEEVDYELKYLTFIRDIRDNEPDLFNKIKRLPKKARTARKHSEDYNSLLTFFKSGKLRKIYITNGNIAEELDFLETAGTLEVEKDTKAEKIDAEFYNHLDINKRQFEAVFEVEEENSSKGSRSNSTKLIKIIRATLQMQKQFTEDDEEYLQDVMGLLEDGVLPKGLT